MSALPAHLQPLISRLTAWQRNQWARAGYPQELQPFLTLQHPSTPKPPQHSEAAPALPLTALRPTE